jgi:hypothetical protein
MLRRLVGTAVLALLALGHLGCEELTKGPECCALKEFCNTCTTCTGDQAATALKGDETACGDIVQKFKSMNQFCNPEDKPPRHTIAEFVLQCER